MPLPSCFHCYNSIAEPEVKDGDISGGSFIVQDYFCSSGVSVFPYEVEYCSFKVCKEFCWDFDENCIESIDCFW